MTKVIMKLVKSLTVSNPTDQKHMDSRALETEWVEKVIAQTTERLFLQASCIGSLTAQLRGARSQVAAQNVVIERQRQMHCVQCEVYLEKVNELENEIKDHLDMINSLIARERKQQDTILEAQARALDIFGQARPGELAVPLLFRNISVKYMGLIYSREWRVANEQRFGDQPGWFRHCENDLFAWQNHIQKPQWHPFKVVEVNGTTESCIDTEDALLKELSNTMGDGLYKIVVNALKEMDTYNASGRYPTPVMWDFGCNAPIELPDLIRKLADGVRIINPILTNKSRTLVTLGQSL